MESSSTSKRARAPGNISQIAHCLVDGCNADLSQCREYHRRHKVCEQHSKTPIVTIAGREQRFCQQCSRFHSLVEFDEGKRSCRKRLDGHNRRRRKPQPELSRSPGTLFSGQQGTRILSFGTPQIYPSAVVSSNWTASVKPENDVAPFHSQSNVHYLDRQPNMYQESSSSSSQFQFLQSSNRGSHVCQPLLDPDLASSGRQKMFSGDGGLNQVINSGHRALSLLSSAPVPATREIGLSSRMVQPDSSMSQLHSLQQQYGNNNHHHHHHHHHQSHSHSHNHSQFHFGQEMESSRTKPVVSENDSQTSNNATLHFQEMFHNNTSLHSSSTAGGGSHQTLTFLWE